MSGIYIVDDEPIIRMGLREMIQEKKQFNTIQTYADGMSALKAIIANPPDIVLTDIQMPRMDGVELCRQIYERNIPTRVIILSGYNEFSYAQKCMSYGVKEYLLKPITEIELYPVLDKVLREKGPAGAAVFSLTRFEQLLEIIEESIWTSDRNSINEAIQQLRAEMLDKQSLDFQWQMVTDGLLSISRRLNSRGVHFFSCLPKKNNTPPEVLSDQIEEWLLQLYEYRGGNQINALEASLAYIDKNLGEELTLEDVADKLGLTPSYFSHYFKKMTGETFVQYRMRKRIERAKQLLAIPHVKIIDIVVEVGYESYPHFSRTFKKATGISPTEFRNALGIK